MLTIRRSNFRRHYLQLAFIFFLLCFVVILSTTRPSSYTWISEVDIRETRICCLILTTPKNFMERASAVNNTWGPRCDRYYFLSESFNQSNQSFEYQIGTRLPLAPIENITQGYGHLTQKSVLAFLFAYERHRNDFDWFVKADDDTYLIVENLRAFLRDQNSSEAVTFGYNFKVIVPGGYHSGGASYVLSREALRRFQQGFQNQSKVECKQDGGYEDVEIAKCLRLQGVQLGIALDKYGRELFHPFKFQSLFSGNLPGWMYSYAQNPLRKHYNCCSDRSISFHYVSPDDQYFMDFLLYKVRSPKLVESDWFKKLNRTANGTYIQ